LKLLVIHNPGAAAGRAAGLRQAMADCMRAHGLAAEFLDLPGPGQAAALLAQADLTRVDGIVVTGGDGSLFETVNGLAACCGFDCPPLGIVPVGTGNAFARDLGLEPGDWRRAIGIIAGGAVRAVDVAEVSSGRATFHFLNILGLGFVVRAGRMAQRFKMLGRGAYTAGTLAALARLGTHRLEIELDGTVLQEPAVFVEVSNSRFTGTRFLMAPAARLDDGRLDVTLVRPLSRLRLLRLFPSVYEGGHVRYPEVFTAQAAHVRLLAPPELPLAVDGEFAGRTPVDIHCRPGALRFFTPAGELPGFTRPAVPAAT